MRLQVRLVLLLLVAVAAVVLLAPSVRAQSVDPVPVIPEACSNVGRYDHNKDGKVNGDDFTMWVIAVHESGEACHIGGQAVGCPSWVDVNQDGFVTTADLDAMSNYLRACVYPIPRTGTTIP